MTTSTAVQVPSRPLTPQTSSRSQSASSSSANMSTSHKRPSIRDASVQVAMTSTPKLPQSDVSNAHADASSPTLSPAATAHNSDLTLATSSQTLLGPDMHGGQDGGLLRSSGSLSASAFNRGSLKSASRKVSKYIV